MVTKARPDRANLASKTPETAGVDVESICRDCFHSGIGQWHACPVCASSRISSAPGLSALAIAHIDCDAFYASVEKRDRPDLAGQPVIIGGGQRGVVTTACYIARTYGVGSAMPMFKALKACPDAVVIRPDFAKYSEIGRDIRERMKRLTPLVEPVSIDEAYLDLSGTETLHGAPPAVMLARLQAEISHALGLTVSVGLSTNKALAKTASDLDKPDGFAAIHPDDAPHLLAPRPVGFLHGIGKQMAKRLSADGFRTIADLQDADPKALIARYGESGLFMSQRAMGRDTRPVRPGGQRKSVSSETTFSEDLRDLAPLEDRLWHVCVRTADRAKTAGVEGRTVTLKLKSANFKSLTRRVSLPQPTQLARSLFDSCRPMLAREISSGPFRLIGVGISDLSPAAGDMADLVDPRRAKRAAAERAVDAARARFGDTAVQTGRAARAGLTRSRQSSTPERPSGPRKGRPDAP